MNIAATKRSQNNLINAYFMKAPLPMTITQAKDGTFIEINEAAEKYMGLSRRKLIGRKSSETGHMSEAQRLMIINTIKEKGYAKNIELESRVIKNEVLYLLFNVFPIKIVNDSFFLTVVSHISNNKTKYKDDILFKYTVPDNVRIKEQLKKYNLTPRQQETALLATSGYSNMEIAERMHIAEYTVRDYMKKIYIIIGVHNRSQICPKILSWR